MMPSMAPNTVNFSISILLAVSVLVDDLLHQTDNKTPLMNLYQYLMASFNATAVTNPVKVKYCKRWKVLGEDGKVSAIIMEQVPRAKVLIRQSRPTDAALEQVLNLV